MQQNPLSKTGSAEMLRERAIQLVSTRRFSEGIQLLEQVLAMQPQSGEAHNDLGRAHWQAGSAQKADEHFRKSLQMSPQNAVVLNNYGAFLLSQRQMKQAAEILQRALALKPDDYQVLNNMGLLHYRAGNMAAAERCFAKAIKVDKTLSQAHGNLANVLRDTSRYALAEKGYLYALRMNPKDAALWTDFGRMYYNVRRYKETAECYRRAVALDPKNEYAWINLLDVLERMSALDEAQAVLAKAKEALPGDFGVVGQEAKLLRRMGQNENAIALLEKCRLHIEETGRQQTPFAGSVYSELGQLYDIVKKPDEAFACFAGSNAQQAESEGSEFDPAGYRAAIARLRESVAPGMDKGPMPQSQPLTTPVFLVGFPRSGTTLLDQILSSHPGLKVNEERAAVYAMFAEMGMAGEGNTWVNHKTYPGCLPRLTAEDIEKFRRAFFEAHSWEGHSGTQKIFVDKLPLNMLHVGFIQRVFPDAKFILALRHPCDAVLSCFMQRFKLNNAMASFLDLESTARFYDETFRLWDAYTKALQMDVHTIRYEDVVANFRPAIGELLEFLGMPWDDALLEYDKTARNRAAISTPSYRQVSEKLYTRASGRWVRYRRHMEPVLGILETHAAKFGYSME